MPMDVGRGPTAASSADSSAASSVAGSVMVPSSAMLLAMGTSSAADPPPTEQSLAEREAALSALLAASDAKHAELSERMMQVYEAQQEKLVMLRQMEKTLSSQAGRQTQ